MSELKLTTQAIRKILTANDLEKAGKKYNALHSSNGIIYGYTSAASGMTIRNLIKGEMIQVWANTKHPVEDIRKAAKALEEAGYIVKCEGFQCIVRLPQ